MEGISRTAIFNGLPPNLAVRSERLCTFVTGLLDERVTALILRRTQNQNDDGPLSGVGPYIPDDVFGLFFKKKPRATQA